MAAKDMTEMPGDDVEDGQADGGMEPQDTDDSGQLAEIAIGVMQDGSFNVYVETGPEEQEQATEPKTFASIGEALREVLRIYQKISAGGAQDQFRQGFERVAGPGNMQPEGKAADMRHGYWRR